MKQRIAPIHSLQPARIPIHTEYMIIQIGQAGRRHRPSTSTARSAVKSVRAHTHFRAVIPLPSEYARGREAAQSFKPENPVGPALAYLSQEIDKGLRGRVHLTLGSFQNSPIRLFPP